MNRYEKYKDSGIPWIGQIPEHWEVRRLKNIGSAQNGLTYSPIDVCDENQGVLVLRSSNIQDGKLAFDDNVYVYVNKVPNNLLVCKGDIIICSRNGSASLVGKSALVTDDIYACFGAFMMRFRSNEDYRYTYYLLTAAITQYKQLFSTSTINQLTIGIFSGLAMPFTRNKEDQQQIADFLGVKCAEVDELIALQEKMIDELKVYKQSVITEAVTKGLNPDVPLKDSGIEWIGQIPEHWRMKKLKNILRTSLQYGANESGIPYNDNLPRYVRITDITDNTLKEDIDKQSLTEKQAKGYILEDKDILFARSGATVGKSFMYNQHYGICAFAGYLIKASIDIYNSPKFIHYYTLTHSYEEWKKQIFIQATIQNIGADRYAQLTLPIPSFEEQQQIADYLDTKCSEIDEMTSIKQQKIEQLKEYKKSIIYEYVTGKKQVNIE